MRKSLLSTVLAACAAASFSAEPASAPDAGGRAAVRRQAVRPPDASPRRRGVPPGLADRRHAARPFGRLADGRECRIWRLAGAGGLVMDFTDYGGRLVRAYAPDRHGNLADVTIGWNSAAEYEKYAGFCTGALIGRFGNRIKDGRFTLDGVEHALAVNEDGNGRHNNLHSGPAGWDRQLWRARLFNEGLSRCIEFSYESADGEMGFPGNVSVKAVYRVRPDNVWRIDYSATTDKATVINPTHHSYWNLAGEGSGDVLGQELQIFADEYTVVDAGLIPVGNAAVAGTGFDFTSLKAIGSMAGMMAADESLAPTGNWYDHNFVIRGRPGSLRPAVKMRDPVSGRTLEIWTTEPCLQVYGAQSFRADMPAKAAGRSLCRCAALALETQHYPDSPNRPDFPSTVLRPGDTFHSATEYRFGAE